MGSLEPDFFLGLTNLTLMSNVLRNAMTSFESEYTETEKLSIDLKVHSKKAQLLLDSARASFYLACVSGQTGTHANDCLSTCD